VALETEALALVRDLRSADPGAAGAIHGVLGLGFEGVGQYARALALLAEAKAISEALGDRAGVAKACCGLGICYQRTGEYARAIALHAEHKAMAEALGDRAGVARACGNLGNCYESTGEYARALALHAEHRAISEALGDRAGVAAACGNLGNCYQRTGEYARALALHAEDTAISEALGDCAGMARACANLGNCYQSTGEYCDKYARALVLHEEAKAISEVLGDRAGVASACGNIGAGIKDVVATDSDCNELVRFLKCEGLSSFAARFSDVIGIELVEILGKVQAEDLEGPDFSFLRPWHKQKLMELVQLTTAASAGLRDSGLADTDLADANSAFESCDDADLQGITACSADHCGQCGSLRAVRITAGSADWHQTLLSECIQLEKDSVAGSLSVDDSDLAGAPWTTAIYGADTAFKGDDFVGCDDADLSFATVLAKHPYNPGSPGCFANTVADFQEHMAGFVRDFLACMEAGVEADDEWNTYDVDLGNTGTRRWTWCMLLWVRFARDASGQLDESVLSNWLDACNTRHSQDRLLDLLTSCL
jgi:tetratricopeptide (TPR) repeat protein